MFESNIARYSALIRRLFSIKGEVPLNVDSLGIPTFPLLDGPAELSFLRGETLAQGFTTSIAVLGEFSRVVLFSPVKLARVERVVLEAGATTFVRISVQEDFLLGSTVNSSTGVRDSRSLPMVPSLEMHDSQGAVQVVQTDFTQLPLLGNAAIEVVGPWVLGPSEFNPPATRRGIAFELTSVNVQLRLSASWIERQLEAGER